MIEEISASRIPTPGGFLHLNQETDCEGLSSIYLLGWDMWDANYGPWVVKLLNDDETSLPEQVVSPPAVEETFPTQVATAPHLQWCHHLRDESCMV